MICAVGQLCDSNTGRCVNGNVTCMQDSQCNPPQSICLLRTSALGDVTHVVPLVRTLQSAWPQTRLTWIVGKLERANTLANFLPMLVRGLFEFLAFITLAGIFVFGQKVFDLAPGNVIVVFALFVRLFPRITTLQGYLHVLNGYLHAVDAVATLQAAAESHAEQAGGHFGTLSPMLWPVR